MKFKEQHHVSFILTFPIYAAIDKIVHRIIISEICPEIGDYNEYETQNFSHSQRKIEYSVWSTQLGRVNNIIQKIEQLVEDNEEIELIDYF